MADIWNEIGKIPPVTRTLVGSSLAVTLPTLLQVVSPYKMVFIRAFVTKNWEFWRLYTNFFLGGGGINYIFELAMLYRTTNEVEMRYTGRYGSADFAWQMIVAAAALIGFNLPLNTMVHSRPLLVTLTYLSSRLAPPGTQTSLFGLFSFPILYFPYALVAMDLLMSGPAAAASSLTGILVGHLWWWSVFDTRVLERFGQAPGWLRSLVGGSSPRIPGVQVAPPTDRRQQTQQQSSGHNWGSGNRLGGTR